MMLLRSSTRALRSRAGYRLPVSSRNYQNGPNRRLNFASNRFLWGGSAAVVSTLAFLSYRPTVHLDAAPLITTGQEISVDPATSIEFPTTMRVPSKTKIPPMTLVGLGVRTVSFLSVKVYSIGFYADIGNPNLKMSHMSAEEKIEHIIRNSACLIRIVPVRTTSYTHLRDAFMRALQERINKAKKQGSISEDEAFAIGASMRKLKSLFPNSPLEKNSPLDIFLTAPSPAGPRTLIFRDLGSVESDWVATELVLHYFEGQGPSPALKKSAIEYLSNSEN